MSDRLSLASRSGLPADWLYLRDQFPRGRWGEQSLDPTAAHWLQMHAGFRNQGRHMQALTSAFRADPSNPHGLHQALIPTLQSFLQHLDGHHRVESGHYFPVFRQLEPRISDGIDLLDRDHDAVHAHLEAMVMRGRDFHAAVAAGSPGARDAGHRLADVLDAALPPLVRHLDDEEDIVIPLLALKGHSLG